MKFPVLKLFRTGYWRGSRKVGVKAWVPQGRGRGSGLRAYLRHRVGKGVGSCRGGRGLCLRRSEGGGDLRWRLWN